TSVLSQLVYEQEIASRQNEARAVITRIFILNDFGKISDQYKEIIRTHKDIGVSVGYLSSTDDRDTSYVNNIRKLTKSRDFILVNEEYLLAFTVTRGGDNESLRCVRNPKLVHAIRSEYDKLAKHAIANNKVDID
ncbi:MAG: hypothetical protein AAGK04_13845, partial [Planctomycetota bacterium]